MLVFKNHSTCYIYIMLRQFVKYHGSGNDFIIFSGKPNRIKSSDIQDLCERGFGVGADGIMFIEKSELKSIDFIVHFYNPDGKLGSLCGNGSRCAVSFASSLSFFSGKSCVFEAFDGRHGGQLLDNDLVSINFMNSTKPVKQASGFVVNTGSPHYIEIVEDLNQINLAGIGPSMSEGVFPSTACNINFVQRDGESFKMITYERGVERETLSCGTGAVAVALVLNQISSIESPITLNAKGGNLKVDFSFENEIYNNIVLTGPVKRVFQGECNI